MISGLLVILILRAVSTGLVFTAEGPLLESNSGHSLSLLPGLTTVTVVSSTSKMHGNLRCTGKDDNLEIQAALDFLEPTGGTIIFSEGTFTISTKLLLISNLVLKGQGMNLTVIKSADDCGPFKNAGTLSGKNLSNIHLMDFSGDGNRRNNPGNAYLVGTPAYGKFGFYCEVCYDVIIERVGKLIS
jgi:hypothetical protein